MFFTIIRLKEGYNPTFIFHLLNSSYFQREVNKYIEGSALKVIKIEYLRELEFNIPDIETQNQCTEFLNLLDKRNNLLKNYIKLTDDFKNHVLYELLNEN